MVNVKMLPQTKILHGRKEKIGIESTLLYALLSTFFLGTFQPIVEGQALKLRKDQYVVVIDAGSMGSRVHAYKFQTSRTDSRHILDEELSFAVYPGLSSYNEPQKAAESIETLLLKAKTFVPKKLRSSTPLVLKATAGLRMLPSDQADNLLNAARNVVSNSGFLVRENAVEIMNGVDEGIFAWFTVNILSGKLDNVNLDKDILAAIDLGGGSAQVIFDVKDPSSVPTLTDSIHTISTPKAKMDVFSNSYVRLGLQSIREAIFTSGNTTDGINYVSECVNPIVESVEFKLASKTYYVSGKNNTASTVEKPVVDLDACIDIIKQKTMPLVNPKPIILNEFKIVAFSYFIERAFESGIVSESGGEATASQFLKKAREICAIVKEDQPFMCLDLAYLYVLLTDGFGLSVNKKISLLNEIDGHQISWSLGCAYNLLSDISLNERKRRCKSKTKSKRVVGININRMKSNKDRKREKYET